MHLSVFYQLTSLTMFDGLINVFLISKYPHYYLDADFVNQSKIGQLMKKHVSYRLLDKESIKHIDRLSELHRQKRTRFNIALTTVGPQLVNFLRFSYDLHVRKFYLFFDKDFHNNNKQLYKAICSNSKSLNVTRLNWAIPHKFLNTIHNQLREIIRVKTR